MLNAWMDNRHMILNAPRTAAFYHTFTAAFYHTFY